MQKYSIIFHRTLYSCNVKPAKTKREVNGIVFGVIKNIYIAINMQKRNLNSINVKI